MNDLRQYVISLVVVVLITTILNRVSSNTHIQKMLRLVSGLCICIVMLSPLGKIRIPSYLDYFNEVDLITNEAVRYGEEVLCDNLSVIISDNCESYILDKANQMGVSITICIECDDSDVPVPVYAEIAGTISPYAREILQSVIAEDLGIPEENQKWI